MSLYVVSLYSQPPRTRMCGRPCPIPKSMTELTLDCHSMSDMDQAIGLGDRKLYLSIILCRPVRPSHQTSQAAMTP